MLSLTDSLKETSDRTGGGANSGKEKWVGLGDLCRTICKSQKENDVVEILVQLPYFETLASVIWTQKTEHMLKKIHILMSSS